MIETERGRREVTNTSAIDWSVKEARSTAFTQTLRAVCTGNAHRNSQGKATIDDNNTIATVSEHAQERPVRIERGAEAYFSPAQPSPAEPSRETQKAAIQSVGVTRRMLYRHAIVLRTTFSSLISHPRNLS